jgi:sugar (pentulose or hexulose) kinase
MPALASLAERDPAAYARVRWGLQPYEFMAWKLSGEAVSIPHPGREEWFSRETYQKVGLDPEKLPERKCPAGDVIGPVSRLLSLPESAVVVAGTIDTFSAWLGTATLDAGIMCMTTGTTTCLGLVWPTGPNPHLAGGGRQVFSTALPQGSTMESARQVIREWESLGARVSEIRLAGGGSADDVLNQSRAEVFGRPVIAPEVPDSGLVGAAALGAWALGWYGNIEAASRAMARARRRFDP